MGAFAIYTGIICAAIVVIAVFWSTSALAVYTGISGARISIITAYRPMSATCCWIAVVSGTSVPIIAVRWVRCGYTLAIRARIVGTWVTVVADTAARTVAILTEGWYLSIGQRPDFYDPWTAAHGYLLH
jgi:hypothetical protein